MYKCKYFKTSLEVLIHSPYAVKHLPTNSVINSFIAERYEKADDE
jgi:hypothetical protein